MKTMFDIVRPARVAYHLPRIGAALVFVLPLVWVVAFWSSLGD